MAEETESGETAPWPQQLLDDIWLLAGLAIVFWALSYIVWGLIDLMSVPTG
ncbi:MAG: hypothetical protein ABEJ92_11475 [Halobacteriales archaeon]